MVEETFIWTEKWKNQEALLTFLRGQDAGNGSSDCKLNCAFNNSGLNSKKKNN